MSLFYFRYDKNTHAAYLGVLFLMVAASLQGVGVTVGWKPWSVGVGIGWGRWHVNIAFGTFA